MNDEMKKQRAVLEQEGLRLEKSYSRIAILRLIVFFVAAGGLFVAIKNHSIPGLLIGLVAVIGFIALVRLHAQISDKKEELVAKTGVLNRYEMRVSGEWRNMPDTGVEFLKREDTLSYDLDLLGKNSLFQFISVAHTAEGRKRLAETLSLSRDMSAEREKRYEAINELSEKQGFLIDFEALSERIGDKLIKAEQKRKQYTFASEEKPEKKDEEKEKAKKEIDSKVYPAWMYFLLILVPAINVYAIITTFMFGLSPVRIILAFVIGAVITWSPRITEDVIIMSVYKYGDSAREYKRILSRVAEIDFESDKLKEIHEKISGREGYISAMNQLARIGTLYNISFNPIMHLVLAGFLGWNLFIALLASRWNKKNEGVFEEATVLIGEIEELCSLAVLPIVREVNKPVIGKELSISGEGIYHPLINPEKVIDNDAGFENHLTVITGSNMSGKTTFLRTIAINMVLAYAGAPVCAHTFTVPYAKIFTSMRIMDDVSGGVSTFYAEILRIKEMAEYVESGAELPAVCFIDEIFKGTNSADRIVGSEKALKKLSTANTMVFVSTHDFELCKLTLDDGSAAENYHFEEYYEQGRLMFDYKIREGQCTTRNAMAILKMAGLVSE